MADRDATRICCSTWTRSQVRAQKRGDEPYDVLLQKMIEQYDPDVADDAPEPGEGGDESTQIPSSFETRKRLKSQKRGGETYDVLLRKMVVQYDPDAADRQERA
jgi:hypothetical protein